MAVALPGIETERGAKALVDMLSRKGIPDEMLTNCGSKFAAELIKEVSRLSSLRHITTTPYYPICNGLIKHFHIMLKQMLGRGQNVRSTGIILANITFCNKGDPARVTGGFSV